MSDHFPYSKLYDIINTNNINELEDAIFYLGDTIHVVRVWCQDTPMIYAGRLGHFEQAKVLLLELDRYKYRYQLEWDVANLFVAAVPHRNSDLDLMIELFRRNNSINLLDTTIEGLVEGDAFDFLDILLKQENERLGEEDKEKIIVKMITFSFVKGKRDVLTMSEQTQKHPVYLRELQTCHDNDPLQLAIMQGDTTEVRRLLMNIVNADSKFPSVVDHVDRHYVSLLDGRNKEYLTIRFLTLVVRLDDTNLFREMTSSDTINYTMAVTKFSMEELFKVFLFEALNLERITVLAAVLAHPQFISSGIQWFLLYYDMVSKLKFKSAAKIYPMMSDVSQSDQGLIYQQYGNDIATVPHDTPKEILVKMVEIIDSLPRNGPGPNSDWRKWAMSFPRLAGRIWCQSFYGTGSHQQLLTYSRRWPELLHKISK